MFGRKRLKAEIASLQCALEEAHEHLAVATVPLGAVSQSVIVRKGTWYRVSFLFKHTGSPILDLADVFMGQVEPGQDAYFTGASVIPE